MGTVHNQISNYRSFKLVFGYLEESGDKQNSEGMPLGLAQRFAWVLNTYRPDLGPDSYFDHELFLGLINRLLSALSHDKMEVSLPGEKPGQKQITDSLSAMSNDEPFIDAMIFDRDVMVCLLVTERWALVGGPMPYHDSYTLSVYLKDYDQKFIESISRKVAEDFQAELEQVLVGQDWREEDNLLGGLFRSIGEASPPQPIPIFRGFVVTMLAILFLLIAYSAK